MENKTDVTVPGLDLLYSGPSEDAIYARALSRLARVLPSGSACEDLVTSTAQAWLAEAGLLSFVPLLDNWPLDIRAQPDGANGLSLITALFEADGLLKSNKEEFRWRHKAFARLQGMVSGGQGFEPLIAVRSCLGEMAERLSLLSRGKGDPRVYTRDQGLADLPAGPLLRFSLTQEQALAGRRPELARLWSGTAIDWNSLSSRRLLAHPADGGEPVQVPAIGQLVGEGDWSGLPGEPLAASIGTAVWTDWQGACRRALDEAVERDAAGRWWYNRLGITALADGAWQEVLPEICAGWLRARERVTRLYLLPCAFSRHVVMAISWLGDGRTAAAGFSSNASPASAVLSAVQEMLQAERMLELRCKNLTGNRDAVLPPSLELALHGDVRERIAFPGPDEPPAHSLPRDYVDIDLACELSRQGVSLHYIDLTCPDIGLSCCKVISPDLVDWRPRFGGRRPVGGISDLAAKTASAPGSVALEAELARRVFPF